MYSFVTVVFLATVCVQIGAAASSADGVHDTYVKTLVQYLIAFPNAFGNEWLPYSAHELRTTDLGNRIGFWGNQLSGAWQSGDCVDQLKAAYTALKKQAVDAYQKCANSLTPSLDTAEFDKAVGELKTLDKQIQQLGTRCDSVNNPWAKRACQMNIRGQLMGLYMNARFDHTIPVYNDARNQMIEKGSGLVSCIADSTQDILDQVEANIPKLYECPNDG